MIYFRQYPGKPNQKGKTFGLIVDYFGVTKHLSDALNIYTDKDKITLKIFLEFSVTSTKKFRFLKHDTKG